MEGREGDYAKKESGKRGDKKLSRKEEKRGGRSRERKGKAGG